MVGREGTEILDLLMPMLSGQKDAYGKDVVPPLPLSFDRVNGAQPPTSTAPLFRLPVEIIGEVLQYVPPASLARVALVNRDFRQLARSRQFASVHLDYSDISLELVEKLVGEGEERAANGGTLQARSIGPCIRRITVATDPGWISYRHGVELRTINDLEEEEQNTRMINASKAFFGGYMSRLQSLLPTLPHLELLDWEDKIALPRSFFNGIAGSHIQHLKLFRVSVKDEFQLRLPNAHGSVAWPLRTLHLELLPSIERSNDVSTLPLCASILRSCAPTLAALTWIARPRPEKEPGVAAIEATHKLPRFAALRSLTLYKVGLKNSYLLSSLVQDGLHILDVDTEASPVYADFFRQRGSIRSLTTFVWDTFQLPIHHQIDFLRANPQVSKLAISHAAPKELVEKSILPLLVSSFTALTSLDLKWMGLSVSESALEMISLVTTLEQIHLSAGNQFGWRHDWLIDHEIMRKYLARLPSLKRVAFSRDSYNFHDTDPSEVESYYQDKIVFSGNPRTLHQHLIATGQPARSVGDLQMGRVGIWEETHLEHITSEALLYMDAVKKLEWMYIGQLPIQCFRDPKNSIRPAAERDSCWTLLRKMFGGTTE